MLLPGRSGWGGLGRSQTHRRASIAPHAALAAPSSSAQPHTAQLTILSPTSDEPELGWSMGFSSSFNVHGLLGKGGFGVVYRAEHLSGQECAVKIMPKQRGKLSRASTLRAISREASLLHRVQSCPSVVRLFDCFEDASSVQLVMELCHGGDLKSHVESCGSLDEASLARVAAEILLVLRACHQADVLFADVKPGNFCFASVASFVPGNLRAIDFGCSQLLGPSKRSSKRTGTVAFMSPETFDRDFGFKSDVWSLGVTLYFLFSQQLPFWTSQTTTDDAHKLRVPSAPTLQDLADAVHKNPISFDHGPFAALPADGVDFLQRCLMRNEATRMDVEEALAHPWLARWNPRDLLAAVNVAAAPRFKR